MSSFDARALIDASRRADTDTLWRCFWAAWIRWRVPFVYAGAGHQGYLVTGNDAVQTQYLDAGDLLDHRFQDRPRSFHEVVSYLLQQVSAFLGRERLDQLPLRRGQNASKADHQDIIQQMGMNVRGAATHVFLLKSDLAYKRIVVDSPDRLTYGTEGASSSSRNHYN